MLPKRQKKPNTYAFIDSQNLNLGTQRMGWKVDWRKFRQYLKDKHGVSKAYMFIGYMSENEALYEYMYELGFLVVLKPTVDMNIPKDVAQKAENTADEADNKDKPAVKGNVDAELVLYAMKELPNYERAIIVSGDGDFFSLAEYLDEQGKLAHIMAPNWQYSSLLKPFEPKIIRLDQLRRQLSYHDRKKKKDA
jgi:uncharacterized LabA/DUF88 family protein